MALPGVKGVFPETSFLLRETHFSPDAQLFLLAASSVIRAAMINTGFLGIGKKNKTPLVLKESRIHTLFTYCSKPIFVLKL